MAAPPTSALAQAGSAPEADPADGMTDAVPSEARDAGVVPDAGDRADTAELSASRTPPAAAAPERAPTASPRGVRHLTRGQVAYVRCDGLAREGSRFPCPRDRQFERDVWSALRGLEDCALASSARGAAEIRIEFARAAPAIVRVTKADAPTLDPQIVTECSGQALSAARTTLRPERMVVSFHFELR
jgi:hypothetical protein